MAIRNKSPLCFRNFLTRPPHAKFAEQSVFLLHQKHHALESAHALAEVFKRAPQLPKDHLMVVNLSGRGDKDMQTVMHHFEKQEQSV